MDQTERTHTTSYLYKYIHTQDPPGSVLRRRAAESKNVQGRLACGGQAGGQEEVEAGIGCGMRRKYGVIEIMEKCHHHHPPSSLIIYRSGVGGLGKPADWADW